MTDQRARRVGGDRGASTLESLGIVVLAALLVVGVTIGISAYPGQINAALCRFAAAAGIGPGGCEGSVPVAQDPADDDFRPPVCMLNETTEQYSAEVNVWFLSFGENSGFIVQEYADGTVKATVTDGASIGAGGAVTSSTFDAGKLGNGDNAGVDVELGADLTFSYGDTWEFESAEQWTQMKDQLDEYLMQQEMLKQRGGVYAIKGMGGFVDPPKDNQVSFTKVELEVGLEAGIGLKDPIGTPGTGEEQEFFDPNVGVNLSATAGTGVVIETNHETGTQSWTYEVSGQGEVGASVVVGEGSAQGEIKGAFTVQRDETGQVTEIVFQSSRQGGVSGGLGNDSFDVGGGYERTETDAVVTTTTLSVDDSNRDLADQWLSERSAYGQALSLPFGAMVPSRPSQDPFLQLLYDEATTSEITYHNVTDTLAFEAAVKKGWEFGFSLTAEQATASATDANFLGAPVQSGERPFIPDSECSP